MLQTIHRTYEWYQEGESLPVFAPYDMTITQLYSSEEEYDGSFLSFLDTYMHLDESVYYVKKGERTPNLTGVIVVKVEYIETFNYDESEDLPF